MRSLYSYALLLLTGVSAVLSQQVGYSNYDNDFLDPEVILAKTYLNVSTAGAQYTIKEWSDFLDAQGPWSELQLAGLCWVIAG